MEKATNPEPKVQLFKLCNHCIDSNITPCIKMLIDAGEHFHIKKIKILFCEV